MTDDAIEAATNSATESATGAATATFRQMLSVSSRVVSDLLGRDVSADVRRQAANWYQPYRGGSEWASWCCYLSFVRDVVGWQHESHANYHHYEQAAIHGGPQFFHERFCLVSDFAKTRMLDANGKLHCEWGLPAITWGCGTSVYYVHGEQVDSVSFAFDWPEPKCSDDWLVFADDLEERGDERAEQIRMVYA